MSFPGTEHYRERIELFEQVLEKKKPNDLLADAQIMVGWMRTQCDHIEDLQKQNEQAWERAALEARRVLKNGSKALRLEKQVEEQDKEIERLREALEPFARKPEMWQELFAGRRVVWFGVEEIQAACRALSEEE